MPLPSLKTGALILAAVVGLAVIAGSVVFMRWRSTLRLDEASEVLSAVQSIEKAADSTAMRLVIVSRTTVFAAAVNGQECHEYVWAQGKVRHAGSCTPGHQFDSRTIDWAKVAQLRHSDEDSVSVRATQDGRVAVSVVRPTRAEVSVDPSAVQS